MNDPEVKAETAFRKLQKVVTKLYLGRLACDKNLLQRLSEQAELFEHPCKKSADILHYHASKNHLRAFKRLQILRMRKPLYTILFEKRAVPEGHKVMIEAEKKLKRDLIIIEADFLLRRLHDVRMKKDYVTFFQ